MEARQKESERAKEGGRKGEVVDLTSVRVCMRANVSAAGCAMLRMHLPAWIVWVGRFYYSVSLFFFLLVFLIVSRPFLHLGLSTSGCQ